MLEDLVLILENSLLMISDSLRSAGLVFSCADFKNVTLNIEFLVQSSERTLSFLR